MVETVLIELTKRAVIDVSGIQIRIPHNHILHDCLLFGISLGIVVLLIAVREERCRRLVVGSGLLEDLTLGVGFPLGNDCIPTSRQLFTACSSAYSVLHVQRISVAPSSRAFSSSATIRMSSSPASGHAPFLARQPS